MTDKTTRQRIEELLRSRPGINPSGIRNALSDYKISLELGEIIRELKELHDSIDDQILVEPPMCKKCGYDNFNNLLNIPSRCPECKSEWIREPRFTIQEE